MKASTKFFAILSILFFTCGLNAQLKLGVKAGLHSYDLPSSEPNTGFLGIKDADFGFHLGVFTKIQLANIYIEPSIVFNNIVAKYSVADSTINTMDDNFVNLDIPLMVGFKFLILDVHAGPVAHIRMSDYGEIFEFQGAKEQINKAFWGLQVGTSVYLGNNLCLEVRYEKNFDSGDIEFDLQEYKLIDKNSRMMASLGYSF